MQVSFILLREGFPRLSTLYSARANPNDHVESHSSHQTKQTDGECCILAGTLRWFPPSMRCLCSLLTTTNTSFPTSFPISMLCYINLPILPSSSVDNIFPSYVKPLIFRNNFYPRSSNPLYIHSLETRNIPRNILDPLGNSASRHDLLHI
jgi:hypothetical protein